ncbi:MAG: hypothetical protein K2P81_03680 [Bacteriovoracaceae bacterium]|nr:hypothetical protein [Bacteriovoracaceae bacterium]
MNLKKNALLTLSLFLLAAACARLVSTFDDSYFEEVKIESGAQNGHLLFSHNINGETQPCGCNKFPLGGLEQAAGHFHQINSQGPYIYVDSGDLFFPSPVLPENVKSSLEFTAQILFEAAERFRLKFFVPGDQDFAMGVKWLSQMAKKAKFTFLLANLRDSEVIKSKRWARVIVGKKTLVFIGVLDPELLQGSNAALFSSPEVAIEQALKEANPKDSELVILLSHSGLERDQQYAKTFQRLDWIIGGHTQSFTQRSIDVGRTQIVQVLSRNHFIGDIQFGLGSKDSQTSFKLLETREEMSQVIQPNPMTDLAQKWKTGVAEKQALEQKAHASLTETLDPLPTFNSCLECHQKQTQFWQSTAHASAWHTLKSKSADNNPACVGCHSVGWNSSQGFKSTQERVLFGGKPDAKKLASYTEQLVKNYKGLKSVRAASASERLQYSNGQLKIMSKMDISHDFGNVQCLNCHDKNRDHPFDGSLEHKKTDMTAKCLQCHTNDQASDWYVNGAPNKTVIAQKLKLVACPAGK